jgi:hypothetical protein
MSSALPFYCALLIVESILMSQGTGKVMDETGYSTLKGVAEEKHFDVCVFRLQGERVESLITRKGVKKADYLFRDANIGAELKVPETEFAQAPEAGKKIANIKASCVDLNEDDAAKLMFRGAFEILRAPLQRRIKKANTQIAKTWFDGIRRSFAVRK